MNAGGIDPSQTVWLLVCTMCVQLMTPALGLFYGGLVSERAVVNTFLMSFASAGLVTVLWVLIGYSLAFGPSPPSSGAVGDASLGALPFGNIPRAGTMVPELLFCAFQLMFAVLTVAVISGSIVGKMRFWAWMAFSGLWLIFVYCPLAHWVWGPGGWLLNYGLLDFAGGTVVETASGVSALVLAFWLGRPQHTDHVKPHSVPFVLLGAGLLWFGWFGFNAGSAIAASVASGPNAEPAVVYLASQALINTHLEASMAMITWMLMEMVYPESGQWFSGRPSAIGAASGAIVGLVAATPSCGYVLPMWSLFIGFITCVGVFVALRMIKKYMAVDDRLDVFAFHGCGGMIATALTGLFATTQAMSPIEGSFYGGGGQPLAAQCAGISATILLCAVGTTVIYWVLRAVAWVFGSDLLIPLEHRHDVDASQHGERAYVAKATPAKPNAAEEARRLAEAALSEHPEPAPKSTRSQDGSSRGGSGSPRKVTISEPGSPTAAYPGGIFAAPDPKSEGPVPVLRLAPLAPADVPVTVAAGDSAAAAP